MHQSSDVFRGGLLHPTGFLQTLVLVVVGHLLHPPRNDLRDKITLLFRTASLLVLSPQFFEPNRADGLARPVRRVPFSLLRLTRVLGRWCRRWCRRRFSLKFFWKLSKDCLYLALSLSVLLSCPLDDLEQLLLLLVDTMVVLMNRCFE